MYTVNRYAGLDCQNGTIIENGTRKKVVKLTGGPETPSGPSGPLLPWSSEETGQMVVVFDQQRNHTTNPCSYAPENMVDLSFLSAQQYYHNSINFHGWKLHFNFLEMAVAPNIKE